MDSFSPTARADDILDAAVRGMKITDYRDEKSLSTVERVELFILVCRAVRHAHQKGNIHRDLKSSSGFTLPPIVLMKLPAIGQTSCLKIRPREQMQGEPTDQVCPAGDNFLKTRTGAKSSEYIRKDRKTTGSFTKWMFSPSSPISPAHGAAILKAPTNVGRSSEAFMMTAGCVTASCGAISPSAPTVSAP